MHTYTIYICYFGLTSQFPHTRKIYYSSEYLNLNAIKLLYLQKKNIVGTIFSGSQPCYRLCTITLTFVYYDRDHIYLATYKKITRGCEMLLRKILFEYI